MLYDLSMPAKISTSFLQIYPLLLLVIGALDALWLGLVAKGFYQTQLSALFEFRFLALPAIIFYLLYPVFLWYFAFHLSPNTWQQVVLNAALFGLAVYATYDLTNWATIGGWTMTMTIVDILWGTFLSGVSAAIVWWLRSVL